MILDGEKETNVAAESSSPKAAETAENVTAAAAPGASSASSSASSSETAVSEEIDAKIQKFVVATVDRYLVAFPPTIGVAQMEQLIDQAGKVAATTVEMATKALELEIADKLEAAKADIIAHLSPMIAAIVGKSATTALDARLDKDPAELAKQLAGERPDDLRVEDPVKVWADPEHKAFRVGEVVAVHEDGHAFDVRLDDGSVTKVPADGLEYDDRR